MIVCSYLIWVDLVFELLITITRIYCPLQQIKTTKMYSMYKSKTSMPLVVLETFCGIKALNLMVICYSFKFGMVLEAVHQQPWSPSGPT